MKSSVNYKFQVLSRLLKLYFHWNDALFIMHIYVTHLFFFKSIYFPSSHHPIPFFFFSVCIQDSFPTHSLLTYPHWLPLPTALPGSPGTSTFLEPVGSFPAFLVWFSAAFRSVEHSLLETHSSASMPWSSGFSTDLFGHSVLFSFLRRPSSSADSCSLHHLSWYFISNL